MPVELRKRKAPPPPPEPPAKKKAPKAAPKQAAAPKTKEKEPAKPETDKKEEPAKPNGSASGKAQVGESIDLASFGGDVTLNDGTSTTLAELVEKSTAGVVLFTYPKASTPGCTKQACLFRDSYEALTKSGLAIYGLSRDSPKSNTTFKEKQKLPYPLICDPSAGLIGAIGLKKAPSSTQRGVFVVDKKGKVLLAEPGSPAGTVEAVEKLIEAEGLNGADNAEADEKKEEAKDDVEKTNGDKAEEPKDSEAETKEEKEGEKEEEEKEEAKEGEKEDKENKKE